MKIKIGISKTINLGNFENIKPSVSVEDDLLNGESYSDGYERIKNICEELFEKELNELKGEETKRWQNKYSETMSD